MKRFVFVVTGSLLLGVVAYVALSYFAHWLAPRFVQSDDDIGTLYVIWLIVQLLAVVFGAFIGNAIYRRSVVLSLPKEQP